MTTTGEFDIRSDIYYMYDYYSKRYLKQKTSIIPSLQRCPFQPGTHPYSHKPFILLQPLHLSGHFLTQSSPQNNLGHPKEKKHCDKKSVLVCVMFVLLAFDNVFRQRIRLNRIDILNKETNIEKLPIILYTFVLCVFSIESIKSYIPNVTL